MATYFWTSTSSTDPSVGANWTKSDGTTGTAPTTGDTAIVQGVPGSTLADIAAHDMSTVTLAVLTITIPASNSPKIGAAGVGGYWQISATKATISGGGRIKINFGSNQTNCTASAGTSADSGQEAIRLLGTHASNVFTATGGVVGIATNQPGETSTAATLNANGGTINASSGVTITDANATGRGAFNGNSALSGTLTTDKTSQATVNGTGTIATVTNFGTVNLNSTGTVTTVNNYGKADWSANPAARTWTTLNIYPGSQIVNNAANPAALTITTRNLKNVSTENYG